MHNNATQLEKAITEIDADESCENAKGLRRISRNSGTSFRYWTKIDIEIVETNARKGKMTQFVYLFVHSS